ncbi:endonuclease/exonuclease/phosphatase family protein [Halomonas organivorans]|uniref:DNA uptake protein ComE-like DNA-binding protein n=1 Tax=Halomonas organivorans TaxID=257772 RepID=A0A7W5BXT0_9GAMM|nr:endonuclease/exonuclease/phosphatase family protein [Halomonas organivorans]MBB3140173.1 DNA uptake protein ComE-like DNA-binding protein [Halomonas organivorans]
MQRLVLAVFLMLALTVFPGLAGAAVIGSWNLEHLGWNNDKRLDLVARVAGRFDLLAVQELMDGEALTQLERELEAVSGEDWSSMASHAVGRSSYQEHYGFLWRESRVESLGGGAVYIDRGDVFAREPFSATFRDLDSGDTFVTATVHVVYGDGLDDRRPEVEALADYWQWLDEAYPDTPRMLMGDFNMAPDDPAWAPLRALGAVPALSDQATTLGHAPGRYASRYDNIWYRPDRLSPRTLGMLRYPTLTGLSHDEARESVSDHAPVYLALHQGELESLPPGADVVAGAGSVSRGSTAGCVDLNASSRAELEVLPHIGPARAAAIVAGRPWSGSEELTRIDGIAAGRLADIRDSGRLCSG